MTKQPPKTSITIKPLRGLKLNTNSNMLRTSKHMPPIVIHEIPFAYGVALANLPVAIPSLPIVETKKTMLATLRVVSRKKLCA